jgi:hypothetical protein
VAVGFDFEAIQAQIRGEAKHETKLERQGKQAESFCRFVVIVAHL